MMPTCPTTSFTLTPPTPITRAPYRLYAEFAFPLTLMVIMELFGLPAEDRDQFQRWAQMTVPRGPDSLAEEMTGYAAIRGYFVELVARKAREPGGDDLLSALVAVRDEGHRVPDPARSLRRPVAGGRS